MSDVLSKDEFIKRREAKTELSETIEVVNKAGTITIPFETNGRFSLPSKMSFYGYKTKDINDITLSKPNELLEVIVSILNRNRHEESKADDVSNGTPEDLLEILLNVRAQDVSSYFTFYWMCNCQSSINENDQKINEEEIAIKTLKFSSIEQADEKLQEFYLNIIKNSKNPDEVFKIFLQRKYKNDDINVKDYELDTEIKSIKVSEPFQVYDNENLYEFEMPKVKHLIKAKNMVEDKYYGKIKQIQNRTEHNVQLTDVKAKKEKEIKKMEEQKAKDFISYAKALSLVSKNGNKLTDQEKVDEVLKMSGSIFVDLNNTLDNIKFGLDDERELTCPLCGDKSKRVLRRELDVHSLLPTNSSAKGIEEQSSRLNIFIGA